MKVERASNEVEGSVKVRCDAELGAPLIIILGANNVENSEVRAIEIDVHVLSRFPITQNAGQRP